MVWRGLGPTGSGGFVTSDARFIGSHPVDALIVRGGEVIVVGDLSVASGARATRWVTAVAAVSVGTVDGGPRIGLWYSDDAAGDGHERGVHGG
jgi:hypothetical protein